MMRVTPLLSCVVLAALPVAASAQDVPAFFEGECVDRILAGDIPEESVIYDPLGGVEPAWLLPEQEGWVSCGFSVSDYSGMSKSEMGAIFAGVRDRLRARERAGDLVMRGEASALDTDILVLLSPPEADVTQAMIMIIYHASEGVLAADARIDEAALADLKCQEDDG